jgi:hypothetical protein
MITLMSEMLQVPMLADPVSSKVRRVIVIVVIFVSGGGKRHLV